jgi:hypothetical protein
MLDGHSFRDRYNGEAATISAIAIAMREARSPAEIGASPEITEK